MKCTDCEANPDTRRNYQAVIGSLMYAAISTRPNISFTVQSLSQFLTNPGPEHITAAKHVLRYLKGLANRGITY
jgi:hypothetical protein